MKTATPKAKRAKSNDIRRRFIERLRQGEASSAELRELLGLSDGGSLSRVCDTLRTNLAVERATHVIRQERRGSENWYWLEKRPIAREPFYTSVASQREES